MDCDIFDPTKGGHTVYWHKIANSLEIDERIRKVALRELEDIERMAYSDHNTEYLYGENSESKDVMRAILSDETSQGTNICTWADAPESSIMHLDDSYPPKMVNVYGGCCVFQILNSYYDK